MLSQFGIAGADTTTDFNGDGVVNAIDFGIARDSRGDSLSPFTL